MTCDPSLVRSKDTRLLNKNASSFWFLAMIMLMVTKAGGGDVVKHLTWILQQQKQAKVSIAGRR